MKLASKSIGRDPYPCLKDWPEDCKVQCGDKGIVLSNKPEGSYTTAFFEAFPRKPSTFIRGEGHTIEEAEESAWNQYQKVLNCVEHDYRRHGKTSGICKKCGLFTMNCMPPEKPCAVCGKEHAAYESPFDSKINLCLEHYIEEGKRFLDAQGSETDYMTEIKINYIRTQLIEIEMCEQYNLLTETEEYKRKQEMDKIFAPMLDRNMQLFKRMLQEISISHPEMGYWTLSGNFDGVTQKFQRELCVAFVINTYNEKLYEDMKTELLNRVKEDIR